jgi:hypothetical protein
LKRGQNGYAGRSQDSTEGHSVTIETVSFTMEFLLEKLEAEKVGFAEDSYMSPSINASWSKPDKVL